MKHKTLRIENDFLGYLETRCFLNNYSDAVQALHDCIKNEFNYLLEEYPKSKWNVGYVDETTGYWVDIYTISTAKIKKLIKLDLFW